MYWCPLASLWFHCMPSGILLVNSGVGSFFYYIIFYIMYTTPVSLYSQTYPIVKGYTFDSSSWPTVSIVFNRPATQKWWFSSESTQWIPLEIFEKRFQTTLYLLDDNQQVRTNNSWLPLIDNDKIKQLQFKIDSSTTRSISFIS